MFRKRWVRRLVYALAVALVGLGVTSVWWNRNSTLREGEKDLADIVAELDNKDPHWRWDDLDANRTGVPDEKNGALLVPKFKAALADKTLGLHRARDGSDPFNGLPTNRHLPAEDYVLVETALKGTETAGTMALAFKDRVTGLRRVHLKPDYISTSFDETQDTRLVARWLELDAERQAHNGQGSAALIRCLALLNSGRSVGTEPASISQFVGMQCATLAVERIERTLALVSTNLGLKDLQAALLDESKVDRFRIMARGERAAMDVMFSNLVSGRIRLNDMVGTNNTRQSTFEEWYYRKHFPGVRAYFLHYLSGVIEITDLPEHQQRSVLASLYQVPEDRANLPWLLLMPHCTKNHDADFQHRARLRCASVGLAVERFRLAKGRWPTTLDEIPRDILAAIPLDPYDGKPLRYVRRSDGVTVYSIGPNEQDDGGLIIDRGRKIDVIKDIGFRLFDVD